MSDPVEGVLRWVLCGVKLVGISTLLVGSLSAFAPRRSIALYQGIMERFNWRVSPIDEGREIQNTRLLGVLLVLLSLALLWLRVW